MHNTFDEQAAGNKIKGMMRNRVNIANSSKKNQFKQQNEHFALYNNSRNKEESSKVVAAEITCHARRVLQASQTKQMEK
jgi:hypothetical protein